MTSLRSKHLETQPSDCRFINSLMLSLTGKDTFPSRCSSDVAVQVVGLEFARKIKGVACVIVRMSTSRPASWPARVRNAVG